jgi:hypothetical protein
MTNLSSIITTLVLLKGGPKVSVDERAAIGCAVQILSEVERLSATADATGKEFFYATNRVDGRTKKPLDMG